MKKTQILPGFTLMLISIIIISCNNAKNNDGVIVEKLIGQKIILPDSIVIYHNNQLKTVHKNYFTSKIKFISITDGRCPACIDQLNKTMEVKKVLTKGQSKKIDFLYFVYTDNFGEYKTKYHPLVENKQPILILNDFTFFEKNDLPGLGFYKTVLVNNNEIKLVGNPAYNNKLKQLYSKVISNK